MFHKKIGGLVQQENLWQLIMLEIGYKNALPVALALNSQKFCFVSAK